MILVTGSTGFVGRSVMRALAGREMPAKPYRGHINNTVALRQQLADVDTVIHLASAERTGRVRALRQVDYRGTRDLIAASERAGVRRLVVVSRIGADPNAMFPLLRVKGEQEDAVRRSDLPFTILRSASLYGRHDRFLNHIVGMARWSWPFLWLPGGGRVPVQPLWVEDLVRCILLTLARYDLVGETVSLAGEERMPYYALARLVLEAAGSPPTLPLRTPLLLTRLFSGMLFGWWPRPPVTRFWLDRYSKADIADLDSVRYHFGFQPATLKYHVAYLRRGGHRWRLLGLGRGRE